MRNHNERSGRRAFLAGCGAAAATLAGLRCGGGRTAGAAEPVQRNGKARFKFSLAAYSYRELLEGPKKSLTLADFIDDCAKFGLEGTELTAYYFPQPLSTEYLVSLKLRAFRLGLDFSSLCIGNDFGLADPAKHQAQLAAAKKWIEYAYVLGAPVIRVFAGDYHGRPADEAHKQMVSGLEECAALAGERGIYLALENHGGPTATAQGLLKIVKDVKNPNLGVNLDTGNFHSADIYAELAQAAPYALTVQVKATISGADKVKHPSDYKRLAKILTDAGYRGYIVLEYEDAGDVRLECPKHLDQIRAAFGG